MKSKLNEKHLKALELLKDNKLSPKEIAAQLGFAYSYFKDLIAGRGPTGQLFNSEYKKILSEIEERTTSNILKTREILVNKLLKWASELKPDDVQTVSRHKQVVDTVNALTKAVPVVSVNQYSWHTNLTGENLVNEFKRLRALAKSSTIRERVPEAPEGGAGEIPLSGEQGHSDGEGVQNPEVRAKSQTKRFSL